MMTDFKRLINFYPIKYDEIDQKTHNLFLYFYRLGKMSKNYSNQRPTPEPDDFILLS